MKRPSCRASTLHPARASGFSIIELVAVMVIIGALAVVVIPRFNPSGFERYAFRHELLSALRYAQKTAVASGCDVRVQLSAASDAYTVSIRAGDAPTNCNQSGFGPLTHPSGGASYTGQAHSGAGLLTSGQIIFNGYGEPSATSLQSISLEGGSNIQVEPITGHIRDG